MSFLNKYACLYGSIEFTPEEQAEIGAFAAEVMKLATIGDEDGLVALFKEEFGGVDEETFDRIERYTDYLQTKEGQEHGGRAMAISNVLGPLALALAATPLIAHAAKAIMRSGELKNSLAKAIQMNPEIKDDPNVPMYFKALADFAPDVAKNPLVAGNLLIQMHRVGPAMVTPQLIGSLISMQGQIKRPGLETIPEAGKGMMDLARLIRPRG